MASGVSELLTGFHDQYLAIYHKALDRASKEHQFVAPEIKIAFGASDQPLHFRTFLPDILVGNRAAPTIVEVDIDKAASFKPSTFS